MRDAPQPMIAAVNGPAAGAGMNVALACDIRIASTPAKFGETFVKRGLHVDWGGTYFPVVPPFTHGGFSPGCAAPDVNQDARTPSCNAYHAF